MIRKLWPGITGIVAAAVYGVTVRAQLPARVASHWNAHGEVNGWMSRDELLLLVPVLGLVIALVLSVAPRLDPKRRNFPLHAGAYWIVTNTVLVFLAAAHVLTIGYNLGWPVNFGEVLGVGLGLLFVVLGNFLTRVRPNWIFGIRTPWTLSSDLSWRESHRIGGYGFVIAGLAAVATALVWPRGVVIVLLVGIASASLLAVIWSYFAWKRDPNAQGRDG